MAKFLFKRFASLILVIFGVTLLVFLATYYLPSDPARAAAGPSATNEQVEAKRAELGLDKPIYVQYLNYMKGLLKLDMGTSFKTKQPVAQEISSRLSGTDGGITDYILRAGSRTGERSSTKKRRHPRWNYKVLLCSQHGSPALLAGPYISICILL